MFEPMLELILAQIKSNKSKFFYSTNTCRRKRAPLGGMAGITEVELQNFRLEKLVWYYDGSTSRSFGTLRSTVCRAIHEACWISR